MNVVKAAQQVSIETQGAFDTSISPLIELWGFGTKTKYQTPDSITLKKTKGHTGYKLLEIQNEPPALKKQNGLLRIDLSAIAKGFAVDKISQYLSNQGITNYLVEIGGEVRTKGLNHSGKKWQIAIERPDSNSNVVSNILDLSNQAVATSGDYRNYYVKNGQRFSHILNPRTGYPIKHKLAAVTVVHDSAMLADAYATALMVMGEEQGKQFSKAQGLSVYMIIRDQENYKFWQTLH
jgi:thiamine biosynthesis lipoprotein